MFNNTVEDLQKRARAQMAKVKMEKKSETRTDGQTEAQIQMAARTKNEKVTSPFTRFDEQKTETEELVLEVQIQTTGTHPVFHDLDRAEALRQTSERARRDPDVARLHGLLSDAHDRLASFTAQEEEFAASADRIIGLEEEQKALEAEFDMLDETTKAQIETMERSLESLEMLTDENAVFKRTLGELQEVEPLANAFAVLIANGVSLGEGLKSEDQKIVEHATWLLTGSM